MMSYTAPELLLSQLSEFIAGQMGLHFTRDRWRDLERGIGFAIPEFGFQDVPSCIQWLLSAPLTKGQIKILAGHLTVGETYFFRERPTFAVLEKQILPDLIRSRRGSEQRLRIWSAGCCTGEEPYSIAILLDRLIHDLANWNITILATDINSHFLKRAAGGNYSQWSFRDSPPWIKENYFVRTREGRFEIVPRIKEMVTFSYHNLVEDCYGSLFNNTNAMDVILCRNVMMYFAPERAMQVVHNLYRSLVDGGWLIVSSTETSRGLFSKFVAVNFPDAILYRRDNLHLQATGSFVPLQVPDELTRDEGNIPLPPSSEFLMEPQPEGAPLPFPVNEIADENRAPELQPDPYEEALVLYGQGNYEGAEQKLVELLSLREEDASALSLLARVYANQGKLAEAMEWCARAIATDKLNPAHYYLLASILQERDQIDAAVTSLKQALYLDQDFIVAHVALGNIAIRQRKLKEAERHLGNAVALLVARRPDEILPETEGLTVGRLTAIISSFRQGLYISGTGVQRGEW